MNEFIKTIPVGLCQCGCGGAAPIAKSTNARQGAIKGQPQRFIMGHQLRGKSRIDGRSGTPEYRAYHKAKARCENPNDKKYRDYGGRGIKFLFPDFPTFLKEL